AAPWSRPLAGEARGDAAAAPRPAADARPPATPATPLREAARSAAGRGSPPRPRRALHGLRVGRLLPADDAEYRPRAPVQRLRGVGTTDPRVLRGGALSHGTGGTRTTVRPCQL